MILMMAQDYPWTLFLNGILLFAIFFCYGAIFGMSRTREKSGKDFGDE